MDLQQTIYGTSLVVSCSALPQKSRTTVIRPVVSVPVLSEQMVVADPIVSQELR